MRARMLRERIANFIAESKLFIALIIINWSFIFGILTGTVIFSKYIFGPNNLYEEIVELANKLVTGNDINLSPEQEEDTKKDLNRLVPKVTIHSCNIDLESRANDFIKILTAV
jgi:hypothetical protein